MKRNGLAHVQCMWSRKIVNSLVYTFLFKKTSITFIHEMEMPIERQWKTETIMLDSNTLQ